MVTIRPFITYSDEVNEKALDKAVSKGMTPAEKALVKKFIASKSSKKGKSISDGRVRSLITKLVAIRSCMNTSFDKLTKEDLDDLFGALAKKYKPSTLNETKSTFIEFYGYLLTIKKTKLKAADLKEIKREKVPSKLEKDHLLTAADIEAMLAATRNPMHRCLITILSESGARVHEIAMLKWRDLVVDPQGYVLSVRSTKTTDIRTVRLRDSMPYISAWKNVYPHYAPDAHVFVTTRGTTLIYEMIRSTIARIAKEAGITKRVNPHVFRHTRVTELLKLGMREPELKKSMWGSVSTDMLKNYEHLVAADVDNEYKRVYGLEQGEKIKPILASVQCPNCHTINGKGAQFCVVCGMDMLAGNVYDYQMATQIAKKLLENPEFRASLVKSK